MKKYIGNWPLVFASIVFVASGVFVATTEVKAQVSCPLGYVCTPIVLVAGCPPGYTCTPATATGVTSLPPSVVPQSDTSVSGGPSSQNQTPSSRGAMKCIGDVCTESAPCMEDMRPPVADAREGSMGPEISKLQSWLIDKGYDIPSISMGKTTKGYFGSQTSSALARYKKAPPRPCLPPEVRTEVRTSNPKATPAGTPIPTGDMPPLPLSLVSPNGGESWMKGLVYNIKWQDTTPFNTCKSGAYCPLNAETPRAYDLRLAPYYPPCTGGTCPAFAFHEPYTIAREVTGNEYSWSAGKIMDTYGSTQVAPDGAYTLQVCKVGTSLCDASDAPFKIANPSI